MRCLWKTIQQIFLALTLASLSLTTVKANDRDEVIHTVLSITPAAATVATGEIVNVEVRVDDIMELYGADIQLAFDPSAFQVLDAAPGIPGTQITLRYDFLQPGFPLHKEADNSAGTVWYAASQVNPTPPASGSGILFEFDLMAIGSPGDYLMSITNHDLSDKDGMSIEHNIQGAVYTIEANGQLLFNFLPLIKR